MHLNIVDNHCHNLLTNDKCLFGLGAMFIVPGWTPCCVDGSLACAQQGGFWFALTGGSFTWWKTGVDRWKKPVQRAFTPPTVKQGIRQTKKMSQSRPVSFTFWNWYSCHFDTLWLLTHFTATTECVSRKTDHTLSPSSIWKYGWWMVKQIISWYTEKARAHLDAVSILEV